ncbi:MAG TPA: CPBP family intramembrane glutamic endopeptidase [Ignavibacteriales bacterium]|nr:CPBP family intramembrane glutamic endopeptidase [Ignavibacteriales bacterium]
MITSDIKQLIASIKKLDRKTLAVFLVIPVLTTISFYYTSRRFFRRNIYDSFSADPNVGLYEFIYWFLGDFIVYFILPILTIKLILRKPLREFGLQFGDVSAGVKYAGIFIAFMLPLIWLVSSGEAFKVAYPHLPVARQNWNIFLIYEIGMLLYMSAWEFAWRGFTLFGLEEKLGGYAVMVQMIPFVILHNGKPPLETFSSILGGIALAILALRTRSFIYCVIIHFSVIFSIDFISTLRFQTNDYGIGINSLINVLSQIFRS